MTQAALKHGVQRLGSRRRLLAALAAVAVVMAVVGVAWMQERSERSGAQAVHYLRNHAGEMTLIQSPTETVLRYGTATRGTQVVTNSRSLLHPRYQSTESSGVGVTLERLLAERDRMVVGVVGLGAGTLATYSRSGGRRERRVINL